MSIQADLVFQKMDSIFKNNIPDSLYLNYQELSEEYGGSPQAWESYLDDPNVEQFVMSKLAKYAEFSARKALKRLGDGAHSTEVTSLTKIIDNSRLLQQKTKTRQQIFVSYMPKKQRPPDTTVLAQQEVNRS